jgi:hypothetical protein
LPEDIKVYKGHLSLAKDASPGDHQAVKDAFLLAIRRWAKRHGHRVELHATIHITSPTQAHWDYHLWTDANYWALRTFFNAAWKRAGGDRSVMVEPDSIDATARYQAKPAEPDPKSREVLLPAAQSMLGIDTQWSTRGFWRGRSIDIIWSELIREWKDGPIVLTNEDYQAVRSCPECHDSRPNLCPIHASLSQNKRDITDTPDTSKIPFHDDRHIPGLSRVRDRNEFLKNLPDQADHAIGLTEYARRWGVSPDYLRIILEEIPGVSRTDGQVIGGKSCYGGWFRKSNE